MLGHQGVILVCRGGDAPDRPVRFPPDGGPAVVHHAPMDEATAFLATLDATAPGRPTACAGWTAHDLVAHLAAGAAEMADLTESVLAGRPPRPTAGFAEREAPFVAMDDDALRARLVTEALRLDAAVGALGTSGATVAFSARRLTAAQLTMHGRSEAALHRWDLAGDDETGHDILGRPELTAHAVDTLNAMLPGAGEDVTVRARAAGIGRGRIAFASPGQPDVVLVVGDAAPRLEHWGLIVSPAGLRLAGPCRRRLQKTSRERRRRHRAYRPAQKIASRAAHGLLRARASWLFPFIRPHLRGPIKPLMPKAPGRISMQSLPPVRCQCRGETQDFGCLSWLDGYRDAYVT